MKKRWIALALAVTLVAGSAPQGTCFGVERVYAQETGMPETEMPESGVDDLATGETALTHDEIVAKNKQAVIDEAIALGVPDAFIRHDIAEDFKEGKLTAPQTDLADEEEEPKLKLEAVKASDKSTGLLLSKVDTGVLARTKIDLGEYDLGELKPGRLIYNMLTDYKTKGTAYLYFGDSEEPFASAVIKRTANKDWETAPNYTVDVRNAGLEGEGHIYLKFVADTALDDEDNIIPKSKVKTSLFLQGMFFTEGSTPVVEFDLDKEINTIENINGSPKHTSMGYGKMEIKIPEGYEAEYSKKPLEDTEYELEYLRGRGNSTWEASKKPYKIKLNESADLFGMGKSKHWVLLANYYDYSLIRNKFTFYLADQLGLEYTPKSVFVDVVISGVYYGSYQLTQHVRIGKNNINIDDLEDDPATEEPDITGGYLLSMGDSWLTGDEDLPYISAGQYDFRLDKPEYDEKYPKEAKDAQIKYLTRYLGELDLLVNSLEESDSVSENSMEGSEEPANPGVVSEINSEAVSGIDPTVASGIDPTVSENDLEGEEEIKLPEGKTWRDYMDEQSLIDYYLLQEFSKNGDAYGSSSTYLYKVRNGKLYWGPAWDFDYVAWGAYQTDYIKWGTLENFRLKLVAPWVETLLKNDPEFKQNMIKRWKVLSDLLKEAEEDGGILDRYKEQNYYSALANYQICSSLLMDADGYGDDTQVLDDDGNPYTLNYTNEIERLKKFIHVGREWADEHIEEIDTYEWDYVMHYPQVPFYVDDETPVFVSYDMEQNTLKTEEIPEMPAKEGCVFKGWYYVDENGNENRFTDRDLPYGYNPDSDEYYAYDLYPCYTEETDYVKAEKIEPAWDTIYVPLDRMVISEEDGLDPNMIAYEAVLVNLKSFVNVTPFDASDDALRFYQETEDGKIRQYSDDEIWINDIGETEIICRLGDLSCKLKIVAFEMEDLNQGQAFGVDKSITLKAGEFGNVHFAFDAPQNQLYSKYYDLIFASMDTDILEVNGNGMLYAKKPGKTKVVTIWQDGKKKNSRLTEVTVTDENGKLPGESEADHGNTTEPKGTNVKPSNTPANTAVTLAKGAIKKIQTKKASDKKLKIKLAKIANADGYQISVYTSKKDASKNKKAILTKDVNGVKATLKSGKLKGTKKLYVRVRAYSKKDGKTVYGDWSGIKKVKIR